MESPEAGISIHPMRLKILYTFDKDHKNNCLARCPSVLQIQTAYVDEANQIGIIDLKTCVQTIVAASPELVSRLENDFTIYAYDYSELDTPLVGQGMLSWALASQISEDEEDGANMVTGRVTRNVLGLFSKSTQETLEVKLRLVPVPSSTQADYLNSLQKYQQMSSVIGSGFDAQSWSNFVQSNPGLLSRGGQTPPVEVLSPMDRSGVEVMQRMLTAGASPKDTFEISSESALPNVRNQGSRPVSRSGTPAMNPPLRRSGSTVSRPSSRNSIHESIVQAPMQSSHQRRESFNSGYYSGDEGFDDGPAKKRAKIVQTDWSSKPNLNIERQVGRQVDSLRVAASTAASVRLHRPVPLNPALQLQQSSNEEPVRPPTPIARHTRAPMGRSKTTSTLRTNAMLPGSSPPAMTSNQPFPDITSPEDTRAQSIASTPANMPSSPPVMQPRTSLPTSPVLPPMPKDHDSGFMSAGNFDLDSYFTDHPLLNFDDDFRIADLPAPEFNYEGNLSNDVTAFNLPPPAQSSNPTPTESSQSPVTQPQGETRPQPIALAPKKKARAAPSRPSSRATMHSPKLAAAPYPRARQIEQERTQQTTTQSFSQIPASDPVGPMLQRSQTWAGDTMSDAPMSDLPEGAGGKRSRPKRFGKEQTANRLAAAISGGAMPPFCDNCGSIETPAWRKAWAMIFESGYEEFETGMEKDDFVAKEIMDQDDDGNVTKFKAFKIVKAPGDDEREFIAVNLCNPCGLWLHKQKCMRPEARWNKNPKDPKEKKKRPSRPRSQRKAAQKKRGDDSSKSEGQASSPEGSDGVPASEQDMEDNDMEDGAQQTVDDDGEPELPPMPSSYRSASAEPSSKQLLPVNTITDAIVRRVQSSPVRHEIEGQDLTPNPLRRILFSPQQERSKALSDISGNSVRRSPRLNKSVDIFSNTKTPTQNKENAEVDGLDHLFNADDDDMPPPQTPTPTRRSDRVLFKTPTAKTPSRVMDRTPTFSPAAQRLLQIMKTPRSQGLPASQAIATALFGDHSASTEMTPFTRQIHQILSDTANIPSPPRAQRSSAEKKRNAVTDSRGSRKSTHSKSNSGGIFDFPDLPPLNNTTSPSSAAGGIAPLVDFSEFTNANSHHPTHASNGGPLGINDLMMMDDAEFQELLSTDVVMPSSPPNFNGTLNAHGQDATSLFHWFEENHQNGGAAGMGLWDELTGNGHHSGHVEEENEDGNENGRRISPRKNKGKKM